VALVLGCWPSRHDRNDVACAERRLGVVYEIVLGFCEPL
jgi:hypothetical protein